MWDSVFQITEEFLKNTDHDRVENYKKDKWYFWDETESEQGPFDTEEKARSALKFYTEFFLG